jgi:hypothetical protein
MAPVLRRLLLLLAATCVLTPLAARAAGDTLLIQAAAEGKFKVWQAEGETQLSENELLILEGTATPQGGPALATRFGPARAFETPDGIVVELPEAPRDKALLLDHDACTAIRAWHADKAPGISDEQLADVYLSATPDGGKTLQLGDRLAKAYSTRLGVKAVFWTPLRKIK